MKLAWKLAIPQICIVLCLGLISFFVINSFFINLREEHVKDVIDNRYNYIINQIEFSSQKSISETSLFIRHPAVIDAYRLALSGDIDDPYSPESQEARDLLRRELAPMLESYSDWIGEKLQLHFHLPNGFSLVRLWRDKNTRIDGEWVDISDDLRSYRPTVLDVLESKEAAMGLEPGSGGFAIRGVIPVLSSDGELLGSAETLQDFYPILDAATEEGKVFISLYANIELLDFSVELQDTEKYPPIGDFVRIIEAGDSYIESLISPELLSKAKFESFYENSGHYSVSLSPLLDYQGKQVGVVVCAMNTSVISSIAQTAAIIIAIMLALMAMGPTTALILGLRSLATHPLDTIKLKIQDIAEDRADLSEQLPVNQKDEIGELSQWFNILTAKLGSIIVERQEMAYWYKSILDSIPFIIYVQDAEGRWTFINTSAEEFLGKDMESVIGLHCSISAVSICNTEECAICAAKRGVMQTRFYSNGSSYQVDAKALIDINGDTTGYIEVIQDITKMEKLLERLAEQEAEAKAANHAKSSFLASMSHEIRTPMNAIIGMTDLALQEEISSEVRNQIITIKQSGASLLSIINDILDFSKIEAGRMEIVPTEYLFASLIEDLIIIFRTKIFESRLRFLVNIDNNIPNGLIGDPIRIRQVILNILSNAVKYTEKGFISLTITGQEIDKNNYMLKISVEDSGIGIRPEDMPKLFGEFSRVDSIKNIYIEGTGLGLAITQNLVQAMGGKVDVKSTYGKGSIFTVTLPQRVSSHEKLASVDNPEDKTCLIYERREMCLRSIINTMDGLGVEYTHVASELEFINEITNNTYAFLIIAPTLYERIKGRCEEVNPNTKILLITDYGDTIAEKSHKTLTTPIYCIPVANALNGITDQWNNLADLKSTATFTAPSVNILVVDDIITNLKVASGLLKPYEFHVDLCESGEEAINAVQNKRYDIIFMDHMMPEMDGVEAVAHIRAMSKDDIYFRIVPIVALTANVVIGNQQMLLNSGFDDFLGKPIDTIRLNAILKRWISLEKQIVTTDKPIQDILDHKEEIGIGFEIEGLDVVKGVATLGGSTENYLHVLSTFYKDGLEKVREIRRCIEENDMPLYTVYVHALKSVLMSIGAERLSRVAAELETASKQQDYKFILTHHNTFLEDFEILLNNIHIVVERKDNQDPPLDMILLINELVSMKDALNTYNSTLMKKIQESLRVYEKAEGIGPTIESILQDVFIGEYEEAETLIDNLIEELSN